MSDSFDWRGWKVNLPQFVEFELVDLAAPLGPVNSSDYKVPKCVGFRSAKPGGSWNAINSGEGVVRRIVYFCNPYQLIRNNPPCLFGLDLQLELEL